MSHLAELNAKIESVLALARAKYRVDLNPEIRFDLRGRAAGMAMPSKNAMRFNLKALEMDPRHVIDNTVPHEVAHMVAWIVYRARGHDVHWWNVCNALGGNGKRCHSIDLPKARNVRNFIYTMPSGRRVKLTSVRHNKVQRGVAYRSVETGERIHRDLEWVAEENLK